ncbi:hypothetical protein HJTV-1_gp99 [Haloarcula virus HJTV-1]|nr:hypothetical protein HJTV-1_gp99 [Haloarcula virus HJTV-1]
MRCHPGSMEEDIEKIEQADYEYFYSLRRKACWRRRGKSKPRRDVSEIIDIERRCWRE